MKKEWIYNGNEIVEMSNRNCGIGGFLKEEDNILASAAPELLEACESALVFIEELEKHGISNWSYELKLRYAIAKAKGEV